MLSELQYTARPSKTRVAIYLRKSRAEEKAEALANHRAVLTRLAESKGFEYDIYDEIGSSVSLDWREELDALLKRLDDYSHVLVMDIDRLARDLSSMETIKDELKYHNVKILTPSQEYDLNLESSELVMDFQSVIAKAEYHQTKKRMQIGKVEGARRGHWVNGVAPLGYNYDSKQKKLVLNEQEYPVVKEIFRLATNNMSFMEIAVNLNLRGFKTKKANDFTQASVKTILNNRAYVGDVVYRQASKIKGGEDEIIITHNCHPAIVSELEWLEVQKLIHSRRTNIGKVATIVRSAIQGLLYCGSCGAKLTVYQTKGRQGEPELYVKGCWKVDAHGKKCSNKAVKLKSVEAVVFAEVSKLKDVLIERAKSKLTVDNSALKVELQEKIALIEAEVKKQEDIASRLLDSYLEGIIDKEIYTAKKAQKEQAMKVLQQDKRLYEIKLEGLDESKQVAKLKSIIMVLDNFSSLDVQEANRFLMTFISKIIVTAKPEEDTVYRKSKTDTTIEVVFGGAVEANEGELVVTY